MQTTIDGLVLRAKAFEENRILTILTAEKGLVSAFANRAENVRRGQIAKKGHRGRNVSDGNTAPIESRPSIYILLKDAVIINFSKVQIRYCI